jgi:hypothetical protein
VNERAPSPIKSGLIVAILMFVAFAAVHLGFPANLFSPTMYDGWKVGALETCPAGPIPTSRPAVGQPSLWDCDASLAVWLSAARDGFDRRDPSHAPVVRATLHRIASNEVSAGFFREVVVFELADGSVRAIGVSHISVDYASPVTAIDYGPDK